MANVVILDMKLAPTAAVILNRPERRNAVTLEMWSELSRLVKVLSQDPDVRAVILKGTGDHFCSGADLREVSPSGQGPDAEYRRDVEACLEDLAVLPKPTIAAIRGFCLGGGFALALACDFRLAEPSSRFGIPAARLGVVYGVEDSRNLMTLVGFARAKEILFTGRHIEAMEAATFGFVDLVEDSVDDAAASLARKLAKNAPLSISGSKLILNAVACGEAAARAKDLHAAVERAMESEDYREGVQAFREKRQPRFVGR
jgi:enoyl-CoA hydratase/carnithine racemase